MMKHDGGEEQKCSCASIESSAEDQCVFFKKGTESMEASAYFTEQLVFQFVLQA